MMRSPWEWVLLASIAGGPIALRLRKASADRIVVLGWIHALCGSLYLLGCPDGSPVAAAVAAIGLLLLDLGWKAAGPAAQARLLFAARRKAVFAAVAASTVLLILPAGVEFACRGLTHAKLLRYHMPIETVWKSGQDDWRVATITADVHREPDPVLLWRPIAGKPYNAQHFKGPILQVPKPAGTFRIMCYGDSLTDGPPRGDWPARLHRLLAERPARPGQAYEVVNAGVSGYSSHQGLLRFLQDVDRYKPDLIVASYGWNDAAQAAGPSDREFRPPSWPVVALQRTMVRYRTSLVLTYYLKKLVAEPRRELEGPFHPRVSVDEYIANLDRFRAEARTRGIPIVFLTRPHLAAPDELRRVNNWRSHVPDYNGALVSWASREGLPFIDVQAEFARRPASLFSDECHFFPDGYQILAELVYGRLFEAGTQRSVLPGEEAAPPETATRPVDGRRS
ncbi:Arylesterase precursor [Aquisphaera giovannonii]|uniref:Arylesterase n=1 Tax=Aquisphaera giovannonii TaxID=406548 RepID=A0A5B9WB18_9BACT|nr:SGNH/GDSL hydrolase family protein [Aquisphaera giovannonii]QEH37868.1 Arylesterase precursor [Aquisphaera giovannonii]